MFSYSLNFFNSNKNSPTYTQEQLAQILRYKGVWVKNHLHPRLDEKKVIDILGEEAIKSVINQVIDQSFIDDVETYLDAGAQRKNSLFQAPYQSTELEDCYKLPKGNRLEAIRAYYTRCISQTKPSFEIHWTYLKGKQTKLSSAVTSLLIEKSALCQLTNQYYTLQQRVEKGEKNLADWVEFVGTREAESAAVLTAHIKHLANLLDSNKVVHTLPVLYWLNTLSQPCTFADQWEIARELVAGMSALTIYDNSLKSTFEYSLSELKRQLKLPITEEGQSLAELAGKLRAKSIQYCASKFEKEDKNAKDKVKQNIKEDSTSGRQNKVQEAQRVISELDKIIGAMCEGKQVKLQAVVDLVSGMRMGDSTLPGELSKIIRETPKKELKQKVEEPNQNNNNNHFPVSPVKELAINGTNSSPKNYESDKFIWMIPVKDLALNNINETLGKIFKTYGYNLELNENQAVKNQILQNNLLELNDRLNKIVVEGYVTVYDLLHELSPKDKYSQRMLLMTGDKFTDDELSLNKDLLTMRGRALYRQYDLLMTRFMNCYEEIEDKSAANNLAFEVLNEMVPLIQRGYQDEMDDSIQQYLAELELEDSDFRGVQLSVTLETNQQKPFPQVEKLNILRGRVDGLLNPTSTQKHQLTF